jgi:hypothetical protein
MMCNYIKFCAGRLLIALGYQRHYKIGNSLDWMEMISLKGKINSSKNGLENIRNSGSEWTKLTRLLPLMPASDPLTPFILHLPYVYMLHNTLFPVGTPVAPPPILTPFASMALWKTIHTGMMDVH